jgi:hypothetical protein
LFASAVGAFHLGATADHKFLELAAALPALIFKYGHVDPLLTGSYQAEQRLHHLGIGRRLPCMAVVEEHESAFGIAR